MATTKITSPDLFNLGSLNTALKLPSGTTAERPTSPSTGEWRYNTTTNLVEFWDGGAWRDLQSEDIPAVPSENFNVVLYDGTSATHAITGVGFQPDLVWIKDRSNGENHILNDSTRGASNDLSSNLQNAEANRPTGFVSFDSDGFTLGTDGGGVVNDSTRGPYVAWCWKAGGGTTTAGTGTGGVSSVTHQLNQKAGFCITKFTSNNNGGTSGGSTVTHGLDSAPDLIFMKAINTTQAWWVWHNSFTSGNDYLQLQADAAKGSSVNVWNGTAPDATKVTLGAWNSQGFQFIMYAFKSKAGYSSFGSYTGNGSAAGPIVNTGFEPAFIIIKRTDSADNWSMTDNARNTTNPRNKALYPNLTQSELTSGYSVNYLSNGFQIADSGAGVNASGGTFLYIAFASDASAAPTLPDSFGNKLYNGTGYELTVSGLGFQPSMSWLKTLNAANEWNQYDNLRGPFNKIKSNTTSAQESTGALSSFYSDGFTLRGSGYSLNQAGQNNISYNWKSNPVPTINTDGTTQSLVSANQAAGFSIIQYTGTGAIATVGHGLSSAPNCIITKRFDAIEGWLVWFSSLPASNYMYLNSSGTVGTDTNAYKTISSTTNQIGSDGTVNASGGEYISYVFHSVSGFSKMGSYTGNGSTQSITGLGFQPGFVMIKGITSADNWFIFDSARGDSVTLNTNLDAAEYADTGVTSFDSDGFTLGSGAGENRNGDTYVYMAFKENPVQYAIPSGEMGYLVAAGGGSGYYSQGAGGVGGGGAGGFRTTYGLTSGGGASAETNLTLATGTYTVTVGAGGAMVASAGNDGSASSITGVSSITTVGGGGGAGGNAAGAAGGSGSGAGENYGTALAGGAGTANQGFAGGTSVLSSGGNAAGGGGAGAVGGNNSITVAGNGGVGITSAITGSNVGYAGGGGGSAYQASSTGGLGTHGGGSGTLNGIRTTAEAGDINSGGGGGALGGSIGANGYTTGGSGVVVLRMNTSDYSGSTTGSPTITTNGSETILTYTGSGTYVHS